MPELITREIPFIRVNPDESPDTKVKALSGDFYFNSKQTMYWDEGLVSVEDFGAGEKITWMFAEPEVQYILRGKAEMTYSTGTTSHTEEKTVQIQEGDCYIIPAGARITWKVNPEGPIRRFCVIMPFPRRAFGHRKPHAIEKLR